MTPPLPFLQRVSRLWPQAFHFLTWLFAFFWAFCLLLQSASAQTTNTQAQQSASAPSLQTTNTPGSELPFAPSLQYSNTPTLPYAPSQLVETNLPTPEALPPATQPSPLARPTGTSQLAPPSAVPLPPLPPALRWGPVSLQSHLLYRLSYADGLQASPGEQSRTWLNEVDPGVLFLLGNHWSLDYTPMLRFYSSPAFRDTFDNSVTLSGGTTYGDWGFGLSQGYLSSSDAIIETGSQLGQQTYTTGLNATRQLGSQTSLQLAANQFFRFLDNPVPGQQLSDSRTWSTMDWLDYQFWSRFSAALGLGFSYDNLQVGPDMTSEQLQGRINWRVVDKLSFVLSGGAEDRQFLNTGSPDLISPIFSLSAQYSPFEVTMFSVSASRTVSPSYFQSQITESTTISASLHQRLLGKVFLDLSGGYSTVVYHASAFTRFIFGLNNYDTTFFSARLSTSILKRGTAAVFYSANYNSSVSSLYNYTTTQVGLELTYRY